MIIIQNLQIYHQRKFFVLCKIYILALSLLILIFNYIFYNSSQTTLKVFNFSNSSIFKNQSNVHRNLKPLITIGIPLYNKVSYLERLCLSILQFTNTNRNTEQTMFEMVVIDANSNDTSYEFFENLASILNKPFNFASDLNTNVQPDIINRYHIDQFEVNPSVDHTSSFNKIIPYSDIPILKYDRSCIYIKAIKLNSTFQSNVVRQIVVEHSSGKYIWQIDPDDMVNTTFLPTIIKEISNNNNTDLFEFGFLEFVLEKGELKRTIKIRMKNNKINSNFDIVKRFLRKSVYWQLWHLIVRREVYLKAVKTIRDSVPKQEEIVFASDLFHYAPIIYHCNSYVSFRGFGYYYFYMNKGSVTLHIAKGNTKTQKSGKIIYDFIETLFKNTGINIRKSLQKIYM